MRQVYLIIIPARSSFLLRSGGSRSLPLSPAFTDRIFFPVILFIHLVRIVFVRVLIFILIVLI